MVLDLRVLNEWRLAKKYFEGEKPGLTSALSRTDVREVGATSKRSKVKQRVVTREGAKQ
jgi:hypothetical protein